MKTLGPLDFARYIIVDADLFREVTTNALMLTRMKAQIGIVNEAWETVKKQYANELDGFALGHMVDVMDGLMRLCGEAAG